MIRGIRQKCLNFLRDEEGQATTEYILMLSIAVMMAVMVMKKLIGPVYAKLAGAVSNSLQNKLFNTNLHVFKIGQ